MKHFSRPGSFEGPFLLRIVSSEAINDESGVASNQWKYRVNHANWREGTTISLAEDAVAYNIWERNNSATTVMGIAVSSLPGTYELQPAPSETYVMGYHSPIEVAYLFQWPNQFDGIC